MDVESQNRRTPGWLIPLLIFLILLLLLCTCRDSRLIESDLQLQGENALSAAGIDPEFMTVGGRDVTLEGVVESEEVRLQAGEVSESIPGIRKVFNNLTVEPPPVVEAEVEPEPEPVPEAVVLRDPNLKVCISDCIINLEGLVTLEDSERISSAATELCGLDNVTSSIIPAEDIAAAEWLEAIIGLLPQYDSELEGACLAADTEGLRLTGTASSEQQRTALGLLANENVALAVQNDIEVVLPELADPSLNFRAADSQIELNGTVPEASIAPAVAAASQAFGADNVVNNLVPSEGVAAPAWLPNVISQFPEFNNRVSGPELDIAESVVTLTGIVESEELKTAIGSEYEAAVDEGVTVVNNLQVVEPIPTTLNVQVNEDGSVSLLGDVSPEIATLTTTNAGTVSEDIASNLAAAPNVATPEWLTAVVNRIPQFAGEATGAKLDVRDDIVTLEGVVESEEEKAAIGADFVELTGPGVSVVNNLEVVLPPVDPKFTVTVGEDGQASLVGDVSEATATALNDRASTVSDNVVNNLATAPNVTAPDWLSGVINRVPQFAGEAEDAELDVDGETITLEGTVASEEEKATIGADFVELTGPGVSVINNLKVVEPVDTLLNVQVADDGSINLVGNVAPEIEGVVSEAAASVTPSVSNNLAAAPNVSTPDWLPSVINRMPEFAGQAERAELDVTGETVTLEGIVLSEEEKSSIGTDFTTLLPESVNVVNNLRVVEPLASRLNVQVNDDGSVNLQGDVSPEIASLTESNAETVSPDITNSLATAPNVATPEWLTAVINRVPEFAGQASGAEIDVTGEVITLEGTVASEEEKATIGADFVELTGPGVSVINNLTVVEPELIAPTLNVKEANDRIQLRGQVSEETADSVANEANAIAETVESSLAAAPNVATPSWLPNVVDRLRSYADDVDDAELDVTGNTITLEGMVGSEEEKAAIGADFDNASPDDVTVINNLQVPAVVVEEPEPIVEATEPVVVAPAEPEMPAAVVLEDPELRIDCAGESVRFTGSVANEVDKQAVSIAFSDKSVENAVALSSDVATRDYFESLSSQANRVCNDIGRATLTLSNNALTLAGVTTSNEQRDAIEAYVVDAVGNDVTVINRLTVEPRIPFSEDGK